MLLFYFSLVSLFFSQNSYSTDLNIKNFSCEDIIGGMKDTQTLGRILKRADETISKKVGRNPHPKKYDMTARRKQQHPGTEGPNIFKKFLTDGVQFTKTPYREDSIFSLEDHSKHISTLHVSLPYKGYLTTTNMLVSKPFPSGKDVENFSSYLIGEEFEHVVWQMHGGGVGSSFALNGSYKALYYLKKGIPLVSIDQPGHGHGPVLPFINLEEMLDWNVQLMKKLIHPKVKIYLHGHSWGGMFTLAIWTKSHLAKYSQIVAYQAESPPIDITLGVGDVRDKFEKEAIVRKKIFSSEGRSNPELVLLDKLPEKGRLSMGARDLYLLSKLDYRSAVPSKEEIAQKKNINIIMGKHDAVLYKGREDLSDEYCHAVAGTCYYLIDKGNTFKGKNLEIGHMIYDVLNTKGEPLVWSIGLEQIKKHSIGRIGDYSTSQSKYSTIEMINIMFTFYANNFAFREFIEEHVEYVNVVDGKKYQKFMIERRELNIFSKKYKTMKNEEIMKHLVVHKIQRLRHKMQTVEDPTTREELLSKQKITFDNFSSNPENFEYLEVLRDHENLPTIEEGILETIFNKNLQSILLPDGYNSHEQVLARLQEINLILKNEVMLSKDHIHFDRFIKIIFINKELEKRKKILRGGDLSTLSANENKVVNLKKHKSNLVLELQDLLSKPILSEMLLKAQEKYEIHLDHFKELNKLHFELKSELLLDLYEKEQLTLEVLWSSEEKIRHITVRLEAMHNEQKRLKRKIKFLTLEEGHRGALGNRIQEIFIELIGPYKKHVFFPITPSEESVEGRLVKMQQIIEDSNNEFNKIKIKMNELEVEKINILQESFGENSVLSSSYKVLIKDLLDKDLEELLGEMKESPLVAKIYHQALEKALFAWKTTWLPRIKEKHYKSSIELYEVPIQK